jgi:hypothetical protein
MKKRRFLLVMLAYIGFASLSWAQTEKQPLPVLNGEWKLDSIIQKQGENKLIAFTPKDIIVEDVYYSCPVKMSFKEQAGSCQFLYENGETKDVSCYAYESDRKIYFHIALADGAPVPEWHFDYLLMAEKNHLSLQLIFFAEPSPNIQYRYFYSLSKQ